MSTALVSIDIQNDYFPGGSMPLIGSPEAAGHARKILGAFREKGMPIAHVQHLSPRPGATFFLPGTEGAEIHEDVKPLPGEQVILKYYPNSFRDTPLLEFLKNHAADRLVIVGMMTHMCVDATVRAAFDHGFECIVLHDACATRDLAFGGVVVPAQQVHSAFLAALASVYAKVIDTKECISSLI